jgi:hypothetical protein
MIFEILNDSGEVVNTIVADLEFVQAAYPGRYREVPQPPPVDSRPPVITKVAFRFRLTDAEYVGILTAAKSDVAVQAWLETFNMVSQIDLGNQRTKDGVALLVSKNLLTQARATSILTDPVQESERP